MTDVNGFLRRHTDRMRRFMYQVRAVRTALLTTASFTSGTAAVWTVWGTAAGLGAMSVFLLWLAHLSTDDRKRGT